MIRSFVKDNSPVLLVVGASVGVLSTAYLTGRASIQAYKELEARGLVDNPSLGAKERVQIVWKLYIPAAASGATTVLLITGVRRVDGRRIVAANAALAVSQRAYEGYREQVIETLGEKKDQLFRAKVVEKEIAKDPPKTVVIGSGTVLCCELFTGRYFNSDMEALNKAVNEINSKLNKHDYATLDDLYYILGLNTTSASGQIGWNSSRLLELEYSTVLSPDQRPCLAFDYNYVEPL